MSVEILNEVRCVLGEGPAWQASTQTLFWTDIEGRQVHAAAADGRGLRSWKTLAPPSAVIPATDSKVLITAGQQVLELCTESGETRPEVQLLGEPTDNRCNDAKCDPFGNLWVGTMDSNHKRQQGRLWRVDFNRASKILLDGVGISNTLAWDTARNRFYFADSMLGDIYMFDYDSASGEISKQRLFLKKDAAPGEPDGSAIDAEGFLWNARWDGGCVIRVAPDGTVDQLIELPAKRPTSCAFGGADMRTLFVTSALPPTPIDGDQGGAVFCVNVNVPGAAIPECSRGRA